MDEKFLFLAHESFSDLLVNFIPRLYGRSSSIDPLVWKLPRVKRRKDCRCYSWFLYFIGSTKTTLVKSSHPVATRHIEWQKERTGVIRGSEYIAKSNGEMYRLFEFMKQEELVIS